jgi:hypothetical protein
MISPKLQALISAVIDNADGTGCDDDLTVTSRAAIAALDAYVEPMSQAEYVESDGIPCPYCRSNDVDYSGDLRLKGNKVYHDCDCSDCGKAWVEEYTLTGYEA